MKKQTTKPIKTKVVVEESKREVIPVTLKSFTVKATIAVGSYANICPEITVEAYELEDARAYVMPMIEEMFKQYTGYLEKKPEPSVKVTPVNTTVVVNHPKVFTPAPTPDVEPKVVSVAMEAAMNAVSKCYNLDDLKTLEGKIDASTKLTKDEKGELTLAIMSKETEIKYNNK